MTKDQLPSALERRRMCQEGASGLEKTAQAFLDTGRWGEALECIQAGGDMSGAGNLASLALEAGDLFYYLQAKRVLDQPASPGDLRQISDQAARLGKKAFADSAARRISSEELEQ